jgi:phosphoenolpyruvate carboxykinase (ATP)
MLAERLERHDVPVWLVNTGWTGGPYGTGERMRIDHTRVMVRAALLHVPGVPDEVLRPRDTWPDPEAYDAKARELARMFARTSRPTPTGCRKRFAPRGRALDS